MDSLQIDGPAGRTFQLCTIILLKSFLILFCFFFSMMSRTSGSLEKEQVTFRTIYKKTKELCNFL